MQIKPDLTTTNSSAAAPAPPPPTVCGNCGAEERRLLHHVRHRGNFRRLCTTCVLRLNPQSFCPTCFQVYPPTPSNDAVLSCFKCFSYSHSHCAEAGGGPTSPPNPYICPLCLHPNTPIFKLKSSKETNVEISEGMNVKIEDCRVMDRESAKQLLAAAKIASLSMNKAAVAAKAEAERRAKEAAFTRKRAKEALEHVARLAVKEKVRKKEDALTASGYPGGGMKMEREYNVNVSSSNRNGSVVSTSVPSMVVEEKIITGGNVNRVDSSNQVLAALNAVELRENKKVGVGIKSWNVGSGVPLTNDHTPMDVDEKGSMGVSAGENVGGLVQERNNNIGSDRINFAEMKSGAETLDTREEKIEDVTDEVVVVDQMQYKEKGNGVEQHSNEASL